MKRLRGVLAAKGAEGVGSAMARTTAVMKKEGMSPTAWLWRMMAGPRPKGG